MLIIPDFTLYIVDNIKNQNTKGTNFKYSGYINMVYINEIVKKRNKFLNYRAYTN